MKKKTLLALCFTLATLGIHAQGPNGSGTYYSAANGAKGEALKTALYNIISKKKHSPSYDELLELYKKTDTRDDGCVRDWYSNITHFKHIEDKAGNYQKEGDVYNREHLVPQSWGPPKADIVHVVPTDGYVNNRRSNYPFGEVGRPTYQSANGYSKLGSCKTDGYSGTVFEPNDEVKGDIARIYFYMATCYEDQAKNWEGVFGGTTYQPMAQWTFDMMVRWSKLDPIDDVEIARNNAVYLSNVQGNRNPFVDYPGLEDYVWGSKKDTPFSYDNYDSGDVVIIERVAQPVFSPAGGTYTDSVEVTITTATAGATILYTTNGTEAETYGLVYTGPVKLKANTMLKAVAVKDSMTTSYQTTANYIIKSGQPGNHDSNETVIALNSNTLGALVSGKSDYSFSQDGVTVTYSKGSSANQYISDSQIRLYAGNTITISANGFITDVEFTKVGGKGDKVLEASEGTVSDMSWSGLAPSIVFNTNSGSGHIQLSSVKVSIAIESQKLQGDVNGDGQVTLEDIRAVIHSIVGLSQNGETDVNGDGRVDIGDILAIIAIR
ncbi:MAG: endonuclease [Prevotella sp.]|nr:endonuclease [Prevotella sp.]